MKYIGCNHLAVIIEENNVSPLAIGILAAAVYTFTGSNHYNHLANWSVGNHPPYPLPSDQNHHHQ